MMDSLGYGYGWDGAQWTLHDGNGVLLAGSFTLEYMGYAAVPFTISGEGLGFG